MQCSKGIVFFACYLFLTQQALLQRSFTSPFHSLPLLLLSLYRKGTKFDYFPRSLLVVLDRSRVPSCSVSLVLLFLLQIFFMGKALSEVCYEYVKTERLICSCA